MEKVLYILLGSFALEYVNILICEICFKLCPDSSFFLTQFIVYRAIWVTLLKFSSDHVIFLLSPVSRIKSKLCYNFPHYFSSTTLYIIYFIICSYVYLPYFIKQTLYFTLHIFTHFVPFVEKTPSLISQQCFPYSNAVVLSLSHWGLFLNFHLFYPIPYKCWWSPIYQSISLY